MTLSVTFSIVATVVQGCGASPDHGAATASAPGDGKVSQQAPPGQGAHASPSLAARPGSPDGRTGKPVAKPTRSAPPPAPLPRSPATKLSIPALSLEAPVVALPLDPAGHPGTPPIDKPKLVGWHGDGPAPGEKGTALAIGHRDTLTGPAVFLNISMLRPGNTVRVTRADRRTAVFTVDAVRTYQKKSFPDKEVYGERGRPELRLITCGGRFDKKAGYAANVVVFAHLTGVAKA
ncbi:class F sortase [Streptomyces californicus]|uniref:class F sortase n=1 Tax=Streptomyces TaxID=1883 RepID=UPI00211B2829|nr:MULTISPECIES: class F sortase [Streptomyces]MDW4897294.1 class F sortase [Streptomyces californicus]